MSEPCDPATPWNQELPRSEEERRIDRLMAETLELIYQLARQTGRPVGDILDEALDKLKRGETR